MLKAKMCAPALARSCIWHTHDGDAVGVQTSIASFFGNDATALCDMQPFAACVLKQKAPSG